MPYRNIVFAKLEKRLFNDYRWYIMSEQAQLNFIKFILFACETYNRIPKAPSIIRLAFKTNQDEETIVNTVHEIKNNFPSFMEDDKFYYFKDFQEKTNFVSDREILGKSLGVAKVAVDKDKEKIKKRKEKNVSNFDEVWNRYPNRVGKKAAKRHFESTVKTPEDYISLNSALDNYLKSERVRKGYVQNGSTWFNDWETWVNPPEKEKSDVPESVRPYLRRE